jgi:hypothetical protein
MLRRLQFLADKATEQELRRGALWSAALVLGIIAITWVVSYFAFYNKASDPPIWLDIFVFAISLPLALGYVTGSGIGRLITFASGSHAPIIYWIGLAIGFAVNWYLYFLIFSIWIHRRNNRKQQRAAAQGT